MSKLQFKISPNYNQSELFKIFGEHARFVFGVYVITFNGKDFSADNPSDLFQKVIAEYENIKKKNEQ